MCYSNILQHAHPPRLERSIVPTGDQCPPTHLLPWMVDPEEKAASTSVVVDCMERLERVKADTEYGFGLSTEGNPWEFPPAAVAANGLESVRKYYDTWEQCDFSLVEIHALKVVFVGAYGAGKTR